MVKTVFTDIHKAPKNLQSDKKKNQQRIASNRVFNVLKNMFLAASRDHINFHSSMDEREALPVVTTYSSC